jgi:hypothetical protein
MQLLGLLPLLFFIAQGVHYWLTNELGNMFWMCNLGNLILALGLFARSCRWTGGRGGGNQNVSNGSAFVELCLWLVSRRAINLALLHRARAQRQPRTLHPARLGARV